MSPAPGSPGGAPDRVRCGWARGNDLYLAYHDREWGVPVTDDRTLFELLTLEGAQAGLSWSTILNKREGYRRAFRDFDLDAVARMRPSTVEKLLTDPGIVRHRGKVESTVSNASAALDVRKELGSLAPFLWSFVGGRPKQNQWQRLADIPAQTPESLAMSRALRQRGFRFVGPTICYAFMQAAGMVNDHEVGCFRYAEVEALGRGFHL